MNNPHLFTTTPPWGSAGFVLSDVNGDISGVTLTQDLEYESHHTLRGNSWQEVKQVWGPLRNAGEGWFSTWSVVQWYAESTGWLILMVEFPQSVKFNLISISYLPPTALSEAKKLHKCCKKIYWVRNVLVAWGLMNQNRGVARSEKSSTKQLRLSEQLPPQDRGVQSRVIDLAFFRELVWHVVGNNGWHSLSSFVVRPAEAS